MHAYHLWDYTARPCALCSFGGLGTFQLQSVTMALAAELELKLASAGAVRQRQGSYSTGRTRKPILNDSFPVKCNPVGRAAFGKDGI